MNKKELKHQVKDLYNELNECIEHSPRIVEFVLSMAKVSNKIERELNNGIYMREIKRRKLTNDFIKELIPYDIHEALDIEIKEARKKLKNFDFTIKEKNIILDTFKGGAERFLNRYDGEVIN
ncbi:Uncharacterised protein [uncultured Clostridium sp.]|nr:Uncharacterised protein [uncultured Clostridium sp.]